MAVLDLLVNIRQHIAEAHNLSWQLTAEARPDLYQDAVAVQYAIDRVQTALHNLTYCAAKSKVQDSP